MSVRWLVTLVAISGFTADLFAQNQFVHSVLEKNDFNLCSSGKSAPLYGSKEDHAGVIRALGDLQSDLARVTDTKPEIFTDKIPDDAGLVLAGTIGKNKWIDELIQNKKIDTVNVAGKWETYLIQVVENPFPKVKRALVIAGSDKRGTIFGIYELSKQIGVSPLYWWADVPVKKSKNLFVSPGPHTAGEPLVKYRGIFINDEAPALSGWVAEKFPNTPDKPQGFNHLFYEKVFELILRMKGNYLWPAMWGRAFYDDDPINPKIADDYGIVIGTTHHEPMMRAHVEWERYGSGEWNYETNPDKLRDFWTKGIERMGSYESIVSLAMRGDGDKAMSAGTNIALLEKIVKDQREIIAKVTGEDITATPQLWALYKEVQDYYDQGMRAPDDVTLLLCDDNWGNIRKLPKPGDKPRSGGYGIYYHFDYVGGPRNYKWLNTNPIARVWEQMNMAYEYGADRIWIVNVGDLKPMEFPIEFFLDLAWNPKQLNPDNLGNYTTEWVKRQFGNNNTREIADLITSYTKFNGRRKPELLSAETYSLINYREAETVVAEYNKLATDAERINNTLPPDYRDAFFQIVLHPIRACSNLNEMYYAIAKNRMYATQGRASTNDWAIKARSLYDRDAEITKSYNVTLAGGKWNHMMDQTHIGYTYWQQPPQNKMPSVKEIETPAKSEMGVSIEGSEQWWPNDTGDAILPTFYENQTSSSFVEIFNRGNIPFEYSIRAEHPGVKISLNKGVVAKEVRLQLTVNWLNVSESKYHVPVIIQGPSGQTVTVYVNIQKASKHLKTSFSGFVEGNGYVSMEASHFSKAVNSPSIEWKTIPDLGRTLSGVTSFPVTAQSQMPGGNSPHLEYNIFLSDSGAVRVNAYLSPTLNFNATKGLQYAVSFDDEIPQVVNLHEDSSNKAWENWVSDNINIKTSVHAVRKGGQHVLKFWMIDSGVVLQKLVVDMGGVRTSYLGPPESYFQNIKSVK